MIKWAVAVTATYDDSEETFDVKLHSCTIIAGNAKREPSHFLRVSRIEISCSDMIGLDQIQSSK